MFNSTLGRLYPIGKSALQSFRRGVDPFETHASTRRDSPLCNPQRQHSTEVGLALSRMKVLEADFAT